jgi:threonine/homoserine/homoserine lactone efflux protein
MAIPILFPAPELLLYVALMAGTPGPLNLTLLTLGLGGRRSFGTGIVLAAMTGYAILFAVTSSMARQIADMNPAAFTVLQWAAAGLLLWLAWKIVRSRPAGANGPNDGEGGLLGGFAAGVAIVGMGPKAWSTAVAAGLLFCDGALTPAQHAVQFGIVGAGAVLLFCTPWLLGGLALGRRLTSPGALRAVNLTSGGILAGLAAMTVMA